MNATIGLEDAEEILGWDVSDEALEIAGAGHEIAGGYTLGQVVPGKNSGSPQLLNQHIVVVAFGEA